MEGQFLVRQIYEDEITYNLIGAAVEILSKSYPAYTSKTAAAAGILYPPPLENCHWESFQIEKYPSTEDEHR